MVAVCLPYLGVDWAVMQVLGLLVALLLWPAFIAISVLVDPDARRWVRRHFTRNGRALAKADR